MNRKQRMQNRNNYERSKPRPICPECGEPGPHFVVPNVLYPDGFWTCDKFYGPDGRRIQ
jgi:hypothetical protein